MRLRLRVERNELPPIAVLWPVPPPCLKHTIAQFLQQVNKRVPLECDTWGLEDYSVSISGYEVFHYDEIATVCKDEDEVVIRPLSFADVKARRLTGRVQITADGRHLIDGVPFGRPLLRTPARPEVDIPPRKRQKLDLPEPSEDDDVDILPYAGRLEIDDEDEDEDDSDSDFVDDESVGEDNDQEDEDDDGEWTGQDEEEVKGGKALQARVVLESQAGRILDSGDSSSSTSSSSSEVSSSDSSSSDSESDEDSSSDDEGAPNNALNRTKASMQQPGKSSHGIVAINGHSVTCSPGLPFQGTTATKRRNQRRVESKRLAYLKSTGALPPNATLQDLRERSLNGDIPHGVSSVSETQQVITDQPVVKPEQSRASKEAEELERRRQQLLHDLANGGIDVTIEPGSRTIVPLPEAALSNGASSEVVSNHEPETQSENTPTKASENGSRKRARLDVTSTNRLIFGTLGFRAPKNQEERDSLRKKIEKDLPRPTVHILSADKPSEEEAVDKHDLPAKRPKSWQEKLAVSAVECCDPDVVLSAPPFPFQQRWDPQYRTKKKRKARVYQEYVETYDKYNADVGDALNYDDDDEFPADDDYWEEGALLDGADGDSSDQAERAAPSQPEYPELPSDMSTLPALAEADAVAGDVVVFDELACDASTNWQPRTVTRTVRLRSKLDETWLADVAPRDLPPRKYDESGKRMYEKFEAPEDEEDGDGEGVRTLDWSELLAPKLLLRATPASA